MLSSIFSIEKNIFVTFIASFLIWLMVGGVIYMWVYRRKIRFGQVAGIFLGMFVAWGISELLKYVFLKERPFVVNGQSPLTFTYPSDPSFPSSHSSSAFALAIGMRKTDKRLFVLYFLFAFVVAFGRVISRVHYIIDVVVGGIIGISAVILLEKLGIEKLFKKILA